MTKKWFYLFVCTTHLFLMPHLFAEKKTSPHEWKEMSQASEEDADKDFDDGSIVTKRGKGSGGSRSSGASRESRDSREQTGGRSLHSPSKQGSPTDKRSPSRREDTIQQKSPQSDQGKRQLH